VHVADDGLDASLHAVISSKRCMPVDVPTESAILVSDDLSRDLQLPRRYTIEIVRPSPRFVASAVKSLLAQMTLGIVLADDPSSVGVVLGACSAGSVGAAPRVLELSNQYPPFSARQETVLGLIVQGVTSEKIKEKLGLSVATINRDIAVMQEMVGVSNRIALVVEAIGYGFSPDGDR
jgi:DNA-binding CsgD family transcriptional regulator